MDSQGTFEQAIKEMQDVIDVAVVALTGDEISQVSEQCIAAPGD